MKKNLFLWILSILFTGAAFAQSPEIGITAGLNVSNTTFPKDNSFKAGFQVGVVADFGITNNFQLYLNSSLVNEAIRMETFK